MSQERKRANKLVTADDRTGALEVAAELASAGAPVTVGTETGGTGTTAVDVIDVIDLGSRALSEQQAVERLRAVGAVRAHKIDSTLRGNWVAEVRALAATSRVLIVPAAPALGRTCVDGVVHVHGRPLANGDLRVHLPEAQWLAGPDAVDGWVIAGTGVAIAATPPDPALWNTHALSGASAGDAVIVGPAAAIGATLRNGGAGLGHPEPSRPAPLPRRPGASVMVVCGSVSDVAREQLAAVSAALADGSLRNVAVHATDVPASPTLPIESLRLEPLRLEPRVAASLVHGIDWANSGVVVAVGGDTAAALLGDLPCPVGGYAALGMPWSLPLGTDGPLLVTKAGAFGERQSLVDVIRSLVGTVGGAE